jgi:hypothetical protein
MFMDVPRTVDVRCCRCGAIGGGGDATHPSRECTSINAQSLTPAMHKVQIEVFNIKTSKRQQKNATSAKRNGRALVARRS